MLQNNIQIFIWCLSLVLTTFAIECLPYPVASVCTIEYVSYNPGDGITFPKGYQQFIIKSSVSTKKGYSKVATMDPELYEAMHRPSSIEMTGVALRTITLPSELLMGDFTGNWVASVDTSSAENYKITYLDLSSNALDDMHFVKRLANLEFLSLRTNRIKTIPALVLNTLTKLKYLYLQYNHFTTIPWNDIPSSLIHLDCSHSVVRSVEFANISLPLLEYLNLQYNFIPSINVFDLLRAAPQLKEAHLFNVDIDWPRMGEIMSELASKNISYSNYYEGCPFDGNYSIKLGRCYRRRRQKPPADVGIGNKVVMLLIVAVGSGVLFVYIVLLVFRRMKQLRWF
uniref:Putative membrane glycoprotein lig-1 n=1 Tax=Aedes albopictus TaxID=7160 RepID=A0A1W7R8Q4_AEDAL